MAQAPFPLDMSFRDGFGSSGYQIQILRNHRLATHELGFRQALDYKR
jgi:hypothetical protein